MLGLEEFLTVIVNDALVLCLALSVNVETLGFPGR
jgi:hypothetical protein